MSGVYAGSGQIPYLKNYRDLKSQNSTLPSDLNYETVEEVYDSLRVAYDGKLTVEQLLDGLKGGLANASGDPYTEYLNAEDAKSFNDDLQGTFTGIGAELSKQNDTIVIVSPISGFPAEKAGLKPKDVITEIDGESAIGLSVSEAVKKIRGPKDSTVKLKVIRDSKEELSFDIVRDNITIASVKSEILEGNIGYLQISRFAEDTVKLSRAAAKSFKDANVKGVILDMRGNPGGLLDASVDVSSLWLKDKTVLLEKRGDVVVKTFKSKGEATLAGIPTVVLINAGSASASEITAGALKDNGAATLMGTKSFGKGSVQQLDELSTGGSLKVTIARWFTPNNRNIDKEGIEPDQTIEITDADAEAGKDTQRDAAIQFLNK